MASDTARGSRLRLWSVVGAQLFRIRTRLLLIHLVLVAVPVIGIAFARMHEGQLLAALERDMIHQAQLLRAVVLADPSGPRLTERGRELTTAALDTRMRIRLVDATGAVVADSHRTWPRADELRPRRELRAALAGRFGAATRTEYEVELSIALPITADDGRVIGAIHVARSTQPIKLQLYRLRAWLVRVLATSLVVTTILSLFFAATVSRPLTRLTRIAERIAAGDRTQPPLALARKDEIGQLARAVDRMTRELERRARDQADLAADLSHELKSPLTSIRGAAELLRDGAADEPAARARFLSMILDDAARLDRIVTRLLELSRAESDDSAIEDVELAALARASAARHDRVVVTGDGEARVRGRVAGLTAAIDNLIDNAVQHAAPATVVTVTVTGDRVAVHNRGAAIDPATRARVWDRFVTTRAADGGSGLGLAIVRSVAVAHGGAVGVTSDDRAGTTFWFDLSGSTRTAPPPPGS